jgi:polyisoprenoid-binding protein YceI
MLKECRWLWILAMLTVVVIVACGAPGSSPAAQPGPTNTLPLAVATGGSPNNTPTTAAILTPIPSPTSPAPLGTPVSPTPVATPTVAPTATPTPEPEDPATPVVARITEGSKARYRVREQFADQSFPNDAVGETPDVSGEIVFDRDGAVQPDRSILVVDLRTLSSDDPDRDDFLLGESLESERFPFAEFVVQEAPGLPWPLPREGEANFQLVGDMTLHNVTSPLTWEVTAQFAPEQVTGTATTNFTFSTFHMVRPSRFFLLSVEDNIRLEIDFIASVSEMEGEDG